MKRENILITEDHTTKRVSATKFTVPGNIPAFDCSIHFGEEGNYVTMQNCIIQDNSLVKCSPEDTYDFEVGALISLMKMCGREKALKAVEELYNLKEPRGADLDGDVLESKAEYMAKENKRLMEENETLKKEKEQIIVARSILYNKLEEENNYLKYIKSCRESAIESLESTRDLLINKNDELIEENEKLHHEYDLCKNSENALKCSVDYLNKTIAKLNTAIYGYKEDLNKVAERCKELEEENEKLKLDCEKLQHGYNDMIFCGGRQNGKQYTFLKKLFKSIPKDKVEAAYKEAYNTELPLWQKEVLNQMYGVYKESKEKTELQGFHIETKPSTKREKMWNDILACGDCEHSKYVEVKKEDLQMFAKECNEKKIFNIIGYEFHTQEFWFADDRCIFQIFRKPAGFICVKSVGFAYEDAIIDYLPPMRWDLFKKGRIIVKVNDNNYEDFYNKCEVEIGRKPFDKYTGTFTVYYKYEKELERYIFHTRPYKDTIPYAKKIVNWEDVRDNATSMEDPYNSWKW